MGKKMRPLKSAGRPRVPRLEAKGLNTDSLSVLSAIPVASGHPGADAMQSRGRFTVCFFDRVKPNPNDFRIAASVPLICYAGSAVEASINPLPIGRRLIWCRGMESNHRAPIYNTGLYQLSYPGYLLFKCRLGMFLFCFLCSNRLKLT